MNNSRNASGTSAMGDKKVVAWLVGAVAVGGLPANPRLTEAEWASYYDREPLGPGTYAFGYDVEDPVTGNVQFRQEQRHLNGTVTGSYGLLEPDGNVKIVHYIADEGGYRVTIENSLTGTVYYPPLGSVPPAPEEPVFAPEVPVYNPGTPSFNPQQPVFDPVKPVYNLEQPGYKPQQPSYKPPPQPVYNPQKPSYNPVYNPQQPGYNPVKPTFPPGPPAYYPSGTASPQLAAALGSTNTLGQPVHEQHTPPKYTSRPWNFQGPAFQRLQSRMNSRHNIPALDDTYYPL